MRCFRCGITRPPEDISLILEGHSVLWSDARGKTGGWAPRVPEASQGARMAAERFESWDDMPGTWIGTWTHGSHMSRAIQETCRGVWPGLTWDDLVSANMRAGEGKLDTLWLPYWTPEGWGYQERRLDRKPKVITHGPKGPGFLRPLNLSVRRMWVVVEGWADAAAVPYPYEPIILMGAANWCDAYRFQGDLVFALDPDDPGREATRKALLKGLQDKRDVFVTDLVVGDLADAGKKEAATLLQERRKIRNVKEVIEWFDV